MVKRGVTDAGSSSWAALPSGTDINVQANVSSSSSGSLLLLPFSVTVSPTRPVLSLPAFAMGRPLTMLTVTVSGALSASPSFTTSCTTYAPWTSAWKDGVTELGLLSTAVLPAGRDANDHVNSSVSPSASLL